MEDKELTTLHPYLDRTKNRYPNVKDENIPDTIQRKLKAGDGITIDDETNTISATAKEVDAYTKSESDAKYATKTDVDDLTKVTPTDIGIRNNKLGLLHDTNWLTNQGAVNLDGFEYDESTNTLKPKGGEGIEVIQAKLNIPTQELDIKASDLLKVFTKKSISAIIIYTEDEDKEPTQVLSALISYANIRDVSDNMLTLSLGYYNSNLKTSSNELCEYIMLINTIDDVFIKVDVESISIMVKTISLFGNHSILVPSDSTDANIDLYLHHIIIESSDRHSVIYLNIQSSSDLVVDSITDINTLLKTTKRKIGCSGTITIDGTSYPISAIDWQGAFVGSNVLYTDPVNEEDNQPMSTIFGSGTITDVPVTI